MSYVYVTQESSRREGDRWVPSVDLSPALEFGQIRILMPPGTSFFSPAPTIAALKEALRDFTEWDFLLPMGDPVIMAAASMIAAQRTGGRVALLKWDRQIRRYVATPLVI